MEGPRLKTVLINCNDCNLSAPRHFSLSVNFGTENILIIATICYTHPTNGKFQSFVNVSVSWLWDFYDIKDRILEDDEEAENDKAVIIVNWTKGSEVHFGLLLKDAIEGVVHRLTDTASHFAPIISSIVADLTSLGENELKLRFTKIPTPPRSIPPGLGQHPLHGGSRCQDGKTY